MYRNDVRFMRAPERFKAFEGRLEQIIDSFERSKAAAKTAATVRIRACACIIYAYDTSSYWTRRRIPAVL